MRLSCLSTVLSMIFFSDPACCFTPSSVSSWSVQTALFSHSAPVLTPESLQKTVALALEETGGFQKHLSILGSTGSIGTQTLDIVSACPDNFVVDALSAGTNAELLAQQCLMYKPQLACMATPQAAQQLQQILLDRGLSRSNLPHIVHGPQGIVEAATLASTNTVVTGIVGAAGLLPTIQAIQHGKDIALANKETLISGGPVINPLVKKHGVHLLPADSEHSAIFQCLQGVPPTALRRIILTASGGAFRDLTKQELWTMCDKDAKAVQKKATTHPNWDMGAKITLDSATMMNKGLEVIEAHYLFGASYDDIDIVIHPQSIVHSMIETQDTSCIAQLGWADMRLPIVYSISWPHRLKMPYKPLDLANIGSLTFQAPDVEKYPCIRLAYDAGRKGGTMTAVLNAANEAANEIFRKDVGLGFLDIPKLVEGAMEAHKEEFKAVDVTLDDILSFDGWAREYVAENTKNVLNAPLIV